MHRSKMPDAERRLRSSLTQLVSKTALVRGTLAERERTCGKPNCRCARGEKHVSLYLVTRLEGKTIQLFIPKALEDQARRWVSDYQKVRALLEEVSQVYWDKLKRREP